MAWATPAESPNPRLWAPGGARQMAKALVITEKPSVARDIAAALGGFREDDGYFESDDLRRHLGGRPPLRAARARGDRPEVQALDARRRCRSCPRVPAQAEEGPDRADPHDQEAAASATTSTRVVNACDAGREGELIFREIVEYLGSHKPIRRLWLQSMTDGRDPRRLRAAAAAARSSRGSPPRPQCRALHGLADRHERDARAHQAAEEPHARRGVVGGARADADAGAARRPRARGARARAAPVLARSRRRSSTTGNRYDGHLVRSRRSTAGDDDRAQGRPDLRRGARRRRSPRPSTGRARRSASETRKPSRETRAAALRPHEPPARGEPPLRLVRAPHALRRAALLRGAQGAHLPAYRLALPARTTTAPKVDEVLRIVRRRRRRDVRLRRSPRPQRACSRTGSRTRRAPSTTRRSPTTSRSCRPGALPREPLSGDDKRLFDLVARRFLGAFHPPALWERVERTTVVGGEQLPDARAHARWSRAGARCSPTRATTKSETTLPPLIAGADEASDVARARGRGAQRVRGDQAARAHHRGAPALADGERGQGDRGRGLRRRAAREGHRHARDARRHHREPDRQGLRRAARQGAAPDRQGHPPDRHRCAAIHIDRLTSPELTGEIELHLLAGRARRAHAPPTSWARSPTTRARSSSARRRFDYDELYDANETLGPCPSCGRPVVEMRLVLPLPRGARARSRLPAALLEGHLGPLHRQAHAARR